MRGIHPTRHKNQRLTGRRFSNFQTISFCVSRSPKPRRRWSARSPRHERYQAMSTRFLTRSLLAASMALTGAATTGSAQQLGVPAEQSARVPQAENVLVERLYPVADL